MRWLLVLGLIACGGTTAEPIDASSDVQVLPIPLRCAQPNGATCTPASFPSTCCDVDDAGYHLHTCDGAVATTSETCSP